MSSYTKTDKKRHPGKVIVHKKKKKPGYLHFFDGCDSRVLWVYEIYSISCVFFFFVFEVWVHLVYLLYILFSRIVSI